MICLALTTEIPGKEVKSASEAPFRSTRVLSAGGLVSKPCLTPAATSFTVCSAFAAATRAWARASFDACLAFSVAWAACSCRCWSEGGGLLQAARKANPTIVEIAKTHCFPGVFIFFLLLKCLQSERVPKWAELPGIDPVNEKILGNCPFPGLYFLAVSPSYPPSPPIFLDPLG